MRALLVALTVALGALCLGGPAQAAGFDCTKARTPTEKAICADAALSEADERMARAYQSLPPAERELLASHQKAWLVERARTCESNVECLRQVTGTQVKRLGAWRSLSGQREPHPVNNEARSGNWGLHSLCSSRYGIFDIRIPQGDDDTLEGLDDAHRRLLLDPERDYSAGDYWEAASTTCDLPGDLRIDVKYQETPALLAGPCAAAWRPSVSMWINGRRLLQAEEFQSDASCRRGNGAETVAVTVRKGSLQLCRIDAEDDALRTCETSPLGDFLAQAPDTRFAPMEPSKERLVLLQGKGDGLCEAIFARWQRDEYDRLDDLIDQGINEKLGWRDGLILIDLNGDGTAEALARDSADPPHHFLVAQGVDAEKVRNSTDFWSLRGTGTPHAILFDAGGDIPTPSDHNEIRVMRQPVDGKRLLLVTYLREGIYRADPHRPDDAAAPTRMVIEIDRSLAVRPRCQVGLKFGKGDRL